MISRESLDLIRFHNSLTKEIKSHSKSFETLINDENQNRDSFFIKKFAYFRF